MSGCFPKNFRSPRGICPNQDPQSLKKKNSAVPEISLVHIRSQGNPRKVNWIFTVDWSQSSSVELVLWRMGNQRDVFPQNTLSFTKKTRKVESPANSHWSFNKPGGPLPLTSGPWTTPLRYFYFDLRHLRFFFGNFHHISRQNHVSDSSKPKAQLSFWRSPPGWKKFNQIPSNKTITYPTKRKVQENVIDSKAPKRFGHMWQLPGG